MDILPCPPALAAQLRRQWSGHFCGAQNLGGKCVVYVDPAMVAHYSNHPQQNKKSLPALHSAVKRLASPFVFADLAEHYFVNFPTLKVVYLFQHPVRGWVSLVSLAHWLLFMSTSREWPTIRPIPSQAKKRNACPPCTRRSGGWPPLFILADLA